MNLTEVLQSSPVWGRFRSWYNNQDGIYNTKQFNPNIEAYECVSPDIDYLGESFLLAALVDWLDTEGIYVCPIKSDEWFCNIEPGNKTTGFNYYTSRSEATKAGIIKAFSLLEKKI